MKTKLRKLFYTLLILLAVAGLIFTLKLDTSKPKLPPEEEGSAPTVATNPGEQEVEMPPFLEISYQMGNTGLHFAVNDAGEWYWKDEPDFSLDTTEISAFCDALDTLKSQQTIPMAADKTLEDYGLETPWGSITAVDEAGETLTLVFGNATTDSKSHYAMKNGDETTVHIYGAEWMNMMYLPIYDMSQLPQLPVWSEETVDSLMITSGENNVQIARVAQTGDVQWRNSETQALVDVPDLMTQLEEFQLVKCFSFKPSEKAVTICGFDTPSAVVTVNGKGEAEDMERTVLYFGTLSMDETYRYLRYNDDSTIYLVNTEIYDTLVSVFQ